MNESEQTRLLSFLRSVNADACPHSGRYLLDHLTGTERLLAEWGCDDVVRRAGLFHSIYGTNAFKTASVSIRERSKIRNLIGKKAERLAYLFCVSQRPSALIDACEHGLLKNRYSQEQIAISPTELEHLLEIESANLIEQCCSSAFFPALLSLCISDNIKLKEKIVNALKTAAAAPPAALIPRSPMPSVNTYPQLTIRRAQRDDIPALVSMCRQIHVDSRYHWARFDANAGRERIIAAMQNPQELVLVASKQDELVGILAARLEVVPFTTITSAICDYLFVSPRQRGVIGLRLLFQFKQWAKSEGSSEIRIVDAFSDMPKRSQQYFQRVGLHHDGSCFSLWL